MPPVTTILLTGFGPFPGVTRNPSAEVVARLDGTTITAGKRVAHVRGLVLEVVWTSSGAQTSSGRALLGAPEALREAVAAHRPSLLVSLGVASRERSRFRLEVRPTSRREATSPDAAGRLAVDSVSAGPPVLETTLPTAAILDAVRAAGHAIDQSVDAGRYLCEAIAYEGALLVHEGLTALTMSGFLHVPNVLAADATPPPTLDDLVAVTRIVLEASLAALPASTAG